jgi:para-aminobenzoate synthetase/4-amino-4-deoxychorismate lyase
VRPSPTWARFDDLRSGIAYHFPDFAYDLEAWKPEHVAEVLYEVDTAARNGYWAFGFVSYEAAAGLDPSLAVHPPSGELPLAWFGTTPAPETVPVIESSPQRRCRTGPWCYDWQQDEHRQAVEAVKRHIAAGDTYQCNLTTRMSAPVEGDVSQLYADLVHAQGGSYNALIDTGRFVIASASPELFFETVGNRLRTKPMKGTTRRGRTPAEDRDLVAKLRASPKERAENNMIVDLVRNDVAKLAVPGGVAVTALCQAEEYETVHQLTSEVTAVLRPDVGIEHTFRALFPCGSVTGAPKKRTMEIIRDLEPTPRGVYCGAIGFVAPHNDDVRARFSVAIRTLVVDRDQQRGLYGTGGGITWDSEPAAEYEELQAKAAVLTAARPHRSFVAVKSASMPDET